METENEEKSTVLKVVTLLEQNGFRVFSVDQDMANKEIRLLIMPIKS